MTIQQDVFSKSFKINFIGVIIWSSRKPVFNLIVASFAFSTEFQQAQEECDHVHVEDCGGDNVFLWGQALHDQSCVVDDVHAVEHCKADRNHTAHSRHGKEYLIKEKNNQKGKLKTFLDNVFVKDNNIWLMKWDLTFLSLDKIFRQAENDVLKYNFHKYD